MSRNCTTEGHVLVDQDLECLACGELVTTADTVGLHLTRRGGELADPDDRATIAEWGPVSLGDYLHTLHPTPRPPAAA